MLIDLRTYTLHPGRTADYLDIYSKEGLAVQTEHLGRLIGYFTSEVGPLNQAVHIWGFEDSADRDRRRAALWADPRFNALAKRLYPLIQAQENKLLKPTPFSPIR
jgi:hypothetical protein